MADEEILSLKISLSDAVQVLCVSINHSILIAQQERHNTNLVLVMINL